MEFVIRTATEKDLTRLMELNSEVQSVHTELFPDRFKITSDMEVRNWFAQQLESDRIHIIVAEDTTGVLGYITLKKAEKVGSPFSKPSRCAYIDQVCVTKSARKRGVFKSLLNRCKSLALGWGMDRIEIDVWTQNTAAKDAFVASGFATYNELMKMEL